MKIEQDILPRDCYDSGRSSLRFIVLHATAGSSYAGAVSAYKSRRVSAHYTIDRNGDVYRNVHDSDTAWHAGESQWGSIVGLNPHSIGIEMVGMNTPSSSYPEVQVSACIELVSKLARAYGIGWENILTHAMISPGRKSDPANFTAFSRVLKALMPREEHRVFLNGQEITGQRRESGALVVNDTLPTKTQITYADGA